MNVSQINNQYKLSLKHLVLRELFEAFVQVRAMADELQHGEYIDKLDGLKQNYHFLIQYFVDGVQDTQRKLIYNQLLAKTFVLVEDLKEELLLRNSSDFEFSQKRYFPHTRKYSKPSELLSAFNYFYTHSELLNEGDGDHTIELLRLRENYEQNTIELFKYIWLSSKFSVEDNQFLADLFSDDYHGYIEKCICVSALTMSLWRRFDEQKLMMLFDTCLSSDVRVSQRALVGLCFVLIKYNEFLPLFPVIRNRLMLLSDNNRILENIRNIIIQIIATAETDKISKKMQEEILPEMMKITPLVKNNSEIDNLINHEEWNEENPEWQQLLDDSGITDKLKELSELQQEGADVYMSTFSLLKSFPFFSEISNWFMPFDIHHSSVNQLFTDGDLSLITAFVSNNIMCNSDKYSFCLSILQMPVSQRSNLTTSFRAEAEQLKEMSEEEAMLTPIVLDKNISKQYIQDLFRFFKLFSQHGQFTDMFNYSLKMHKSFLFEIFSSDNELSTAVSEYYFRKNHYMEALEMFKSVVESRQTTSLNFQKIGYCYQQSGQISLALDAYLKADMIQPDDVWTIRKIALCYRLNNDYKKSLEFYQHADFLNPNQPNIRIQIAHCLVELKNFKEALSLYFQLDAEQPESIKIYRAIMWCSFLSANISTAVYYSTKVLEMNPTADDFLNAAHIKWCAAEKKQAIQLYIHSFELLNDWQLFMKKVIADKPHFIANGVDPDEIPLLLDCVLLALK